MQSINGFLIHDCAPQTVDEIFFHKDIYERLKIMSRKDDIPHFIFHGEEGSGKKRMINIFLDMIYNGETKKLASNRYKIPGSGSKIKEEMIEGSIHHIIIKPTGTNFDRYLVHNVVKSYAESRAIAMGSKRSAGKFRVIQIANLDKLSQSAQNSLRRMIEVNSNRCRFIMWANNLSNVIGPLKSRGFCIRVPRPSKVELMSYLTYVAVEKGFNDIPYDTIDKIAEYSENNIRKALWCLQSNMFGYPYETNYDRSIIVIVDMICTCDLGVMDDIEENDATEGKSGIRDRLFNLMITNYEPVYILQSIVKEFLKRPELSEKTKMNIVMQTSKTEYNMVRARREIIDFDAYIATVIRIIYMDETNKLKSIMSK